MTDLLLGLSGPLLLLALAGWLVVESGLLVGVLMPAATVVLALGAASQAGVVPGWAVALTAGAASAAGSRIGYWRGHADGPHPLRRAVTDRVGPRRMSRLLSGLDRYALPTLAVCQCLGVARTVAPRLAAMAGVSWVRHAAVATPVAFAWAGTLVLLGRQAGAAFPAVQRWVGAAGLPVIVAVVLVAGAVHLLRRRMARRSPTTPEP